MFAEQARQQIAATVRTAQIILAALATGVVMFGVVVVFGMPGEAVRRNAAMHVLNPQEIAGLLSTVQANARDPVSFLLHAIPAYTGMRRGEVLRLTENAGVLEFSRWGEMLYFSAANDEGGSDLFRMALDGGVAPQRMLACRQAACRSPQVSPDGQWLAYESYQGEQLEILIQSISAPAEPIRLTDYPGADHSPAWSPRGRQIAFVSNRSGEAEIWLADLDQAADTRFTNLSHNPLGGEYHPAWSPDGSALAWSSELDGVRTLVVQPVLQPAEEGTPASPSERWSVGSGDWTAWSNDGSTLLALLESPQRTYLTAYPVHTPGLVLPPLPLPAAASGLSWGSAALPLPLRDPYRQAAVLTPTPLWRPALTALPADSGGRYLLSPLADVQAPHPFLHDLVDESFQALRAHIAIESGWDFLSTLENAYVPITAPLGPGMGNDWLYTGRAFAFTTLPVNAGWVAVVREAYSGQIYWRVYVRARFQDGSAGIPLHQQTWDFYARYSGDTVAYEQGGALMEGVLPGYWIDFTRLAAIYGWERQPALSDWRAAFSSAGLCATPPG